MTPMHEIEVSGTRRTTMLRAIIDTGFDGQLCVPLDVAVTLGMELIGSADVELADGSRKRELLFAGTVNFLGELREVELSLTESDEGLIGTELLAGCQLAIDFDRRKVRLWRRPTARGKGKDR